MREVDIFKKMMEESSFFEDLERGQESSWEIHGGFFPQVDFKEEFIPLNKEEK